jgi:hypothetical protein
MSHTRGSTMGHEVHVLNHKEGKKPKGSLYIMKDGVRHYYKSWSKELKAAYKK